MVDHAREHLDVVIAKYTSTAMMLQHLADVIESGSARDRETYRSDAIEALEHAKLVVTEHRSNLEAVRAAYDAKVHGLPEAS